DPEISRVDLEDLQLMMGRAHRTTRWIVGGNPFTDLGPALVREPDLPGMQPAGNLRGMVWFEWWVGLDGLAVTQLDESGAQPVRHTIVPPEDSAWLLPVPLLLEGVGAQLTQPFVEAETGEMPGLAEISGQ